MSGTALPAIPADPFPPTPNSSEPRSAIPATVPTELAAEPGDSVKDSSVSQAPQSGHRPIHFGWSPPQSRQTNDVRFLAMAWSLRPEDISLTQEVGNANSWRPKRSDFEPPVGGARKIDGRVESGIASGQSQPPRPRAVGDERTPSGRRGRPRRSIRPQGCLHSPRPIATSQPKSGREPQIEEPDQTGEAVTHHGFPGGISLKRRWRVARRTFRLQQD